MEQRSGEPLARHRRSRRIPQSLTPHTAPVDQPAGLEKFFEEALYPAAIAGNSLAIAPNWQIRSSGEVCLTVRFQPAR